MKRRRHLFFAYLVLYINSNNCVCLIVAIKITTFESSAIGLQEFRIEYFTIVH